MVNEATNSIMDRIRLIGYTFKEAGLYRNQLQIFDPLN